jgi:septin family protein
MDLTIVDTPGFGDLVNNENWYFLFVKEFSWKPLIKYIKDQYEIYFKQEQLISRDVRNIIDNRIHCVLYFIAPTGHAYVRLFYLLQSKAH